MTQQAELFERPPRPVARPVSTVTPQIEVSTEHGVFVFDWPAVPRVGDYIRVDVEGHDDDQAERVRYVVWSAGGITVDCDCVDLPDSEPRP